MAKIVLNTPRYCHLIDETEIVYCKSAKHKTCFFLVSGKEIAVSRPLQFFRDQLSEAIFIYTHRAYIINLKHLESIHAKPRLHAAMDNNHRVPVALGRKKEVMNQISKKLNTEIK